MAKRKYSVKAQKFIGSVMHQKKGVKMPRKQKIAIALSEARSRGFKVPRRRSK